MDKIIVRTFRLLNAHNSLIRTWYSKKYTSFFLFILFLQKKTVQIQKISCALDFFQKNQEKHINFISVQIVDNFCSIVDHKNHNTKRLIFDTIYQRFSFLYRKRLEIYKIPSLISTKRNQILQSFKGFFQKVIIYIRCVSPLTKLSFNI